MIPACKKILLFCEYGSMDLYLWLIRHPRISLGTIMLAGFLLRILRRLLDPFIARDATFYLYCADQLFHGGIDQLLANNPTLLTIPFFPWLVHFGGYTPLSYESFGVLLNLSVGILSIPLFALICKKIFKSVSAGLIGAILIAFSPELIKSDVNILREPVFLFCLLLWLWAEVNFLETRNVFFMLGSGFFAGIAILCRMEGLELLLLSVVGLGFIRLPLKTWCQSAVWSVLCLMGGTGIAMGSFFWISGTPLKFLSRSFLKIYFVFM